MASYEQAPNPQAFSFQPYELPYQQIMQTVAAKTQYWLQGANQLKSAYQQAAGLDLSLGQNQQALHSFTEQANSQVTQAAKSDLSQSDNVQSAMNIFKPLYDGTSELSQQIMGDHAVTTMAKQIQSQYQEAKTRNNGKEYSADNEKDSLQSYQQFVQNQDPNKWKEAYQGLKQYQPYYDYHKELSDNAKGCHASSNTTAGVNGMYIVSDTQSGVDGARMYGCLGSNLSSQAENQIALEGRVRYGQNYRALGDDYLNSSLQERTSLATQRAQLAAKFADPKVDATTKQGLAAQIKAYDGQIDNIDKGTAAIQSGDLSYIKNNYDQIAASSYRSQKLGSMATALSYMNDAKKITADPVKMMIARINADEGMLGQKERFDERMEDKRIQAAKDLYDYKQNKEQGAIVPVTPTINPDEAPIVTRQSHEADKAATQQGLQGIDQQMYQYMSTQGGFKGLVSGNPNGSPTDKTTWEAFKQGVLSNPSIMQSYPYLAQLKDQNNKLQFKQRALLSVDQAVETDPKAVAAKNQIGGVLAGITTPATVDLSSADPNTGLTVAHGKLLLSPQEQSDLVQGKSVRGMTVGKPMIINTRDPISGGYGSHKPVNTLMIGGKAYSIDNTPLDDLLQKRDAAMKGYNDVVNGLYQQRIASDPTWGNLTAYKGPEVTQAKGTIRAALNGIATIPEDKDIQLMTTSWDGKIRFSIPADSKGNFPSQSDLTANAGGLTSGGNIVAVPGQKGVYEISGIPQFDRSSDLTTTQHINTLARNLQQTALNEGKSFERTPIAHDFHGFDVTAIPAPGGGGVVFELTDKDDPSKNALANSPSELTAKMQFIEQHSN